MVLIGKQEDRFVRDVAFDLAFPECKVTTPWRNYDTSFVYFCEYASANKQDDSIIVGFVGQIDNRLIVWSANR